MKAFHGDPAVKEKYLARLRAHHAADEIIQGIGYNGKHGCAVGCTLNQYNHRAYEDELGLPSWLAHLEDQIFEGLPPAHAQQFAVDFLEAVPAGADVEKVRWLLAIRRHTRDRNRLLENPERYAKQCIAAIDQVITYCESQITGATTESAAESAAWSARSAAARSAAGSAAGSAARWAAGSAAWSAARSAAGSAAQSAAQSAAAWWSAAESARSAAESAESAAWSARSAAESASWSAAAAWSAAWSAAGPAAAARSAHFEWEAKTLLELLRNAPQAAE